MKTLYKTLFLAGIVFFSACAPKPTAAELLKDDTMRHNIMKAICNDHAMATEMVNYLTTSDASRDMMKGSCDFMRTEMAKEMIKKDTALQNVIISNMLFLVNHDSVLCDKTCTQISSNPQIERMLQKKMNNEGK